MPVNAPPLHLPLWIAGSAPQPADFNARIRDDITYLTKRPIFRAWQNSTAPQSIPTGTNTVLTLDTVVEDTYSGWTSGASNKYTAQQTGIHLVVVTYFGTGGTGAGKMATALINYDTGLFQIGGQKYPIASTLTWAVQVAAPVFMFAGMDSVQPFAFQGSGGALNTSSTGINAASAMEIIFMSE